MAFEVFEDTVQRAVFFLLVIFTPICIVITYLRFRTLQITGRKVGSEDWLALAALFCFLAWVVCASFGALSYSRTPFHLLPLFREANGRCAVLKHLNGRSDFVQLPIEEAKSALKVPLCLPTSDEVLALQSWTRATRATREGTCSADGFGGQRS